MAIQSPLECVARNPQEKGTTRPGKEKRRSQVPHIRYLALIFIVFFGNFDFGTDLQASLSSHCPKRASGVSGRCQDVPTRKSALRVEDGAATLEQKEEDSEQDRTFESGQKEQSPSLAYLQGGASESLSNRAGTTRQRSERTHGCNQRGTSRAGTLGVGSTRRGTGGSKPDGTPCPGEGHGERKACSRARTSQSSECSAATDTHGDAGTAAELECSYRAKAGRYRSEDAGSQNRGTRKRERKASQIEADRKGRQCQEKPRTCRQVERKEPEKGFPRITGGSRCLRHLGIVTTRMEDAGIAVRKHFAYSTLPEVNGDQMSLSHEISIPDLLVREGTDHSLITWSLDDDSATDNDHKCFRHFSCACVLYDGAADGTGTGWQLLILPDGPMREPSGGTSKSLLCFDHGKIRDEIPLSGISSLVTFHHSFVSQSGIFSDFSSSLFTVEFSEHVPTKQSFSFALRHRHEYVISRGRVNLIPGLAFSLDGANMIPDPNPFVTGVNMIPDLAWRKDRVNLIPTPVLPFSDANFAFRTDEELDRVNVIPGPRIQNASTLRPNWKDFDGGANTIPAENGMQYLTHDLDQGNNSSGISWEEVNVILDPSNMDIQAILVPCYWVRHFFSDFDPRVLEMLLGTFISWIVSLSIFLSWVFFCWIKKRFHFWWSYRIGKCRFCHKRRTKTIRKRHTNHRIGTLILFGWLILAPIAETPLGTRRQLSESPTSQEPSPPKDDKVPVQRSGDQAKTGTWTSTLQATPFVYRRNISRWTYMEPDGSRSDQQDSDDSNSLMQGLTHLTTACGVHRDPLLYWDKLSIQDPMTRTHFTAWITDPFRSGLQTNPYNVQWDGQRCVRCTFLSATNFVDSDLMKGPYLIRPTPTTSGTEQEPQYVVLLSPKMDT